MYSCLNGEHTHDTPKETHHMSSIFFDQTQKILLAIAFVISVIGKVVG